MIHDHVPVRPVADVPDHDLSGTEVENGSMSYVSGTNATYRGNIEEDADIDAGASYTLVVTVVASSDRNGEFRARYTAKRRGNT